MKNKKIEISLGSLFDGIGGFPYAASFYGIKTLWASEIIPAAISVTRRHFPEIEHLGDILKIKGDSIAPVDIVTFGSPCQSFSIAGQREGLEGKSGLFWEAIRIMREMREATNGQYPKYCLFENVPGILSANKGRDYKTVLEAFTETEIPMPPSGKWTTAGMVRGGRIDLAWIIHDAQYFGVAQRRRRLFLICDFAKQRAAEILFKPKSLHRYFAQSGAPGEGIASNAQGSADGSEYGGINTVAAFMGGQSGAAKSITYNEKMSPTIKSGAGGNMIPCVCEPQLKIVVINDQGGDSLTIEKTLLSPTLRSEAHGNIPIVSINTELCKDFCSSVTDTEVKNKNSHLHIVQGTNQNADGDVRISKTAYSLTTDSNTSERNAPIVFHPKIAGTLCASGAGLSRTAGMANETDLCIVTDTPNGDPNSKVCGTLCAKSIAPNGIGNEADMCILQEPHTFTHLGYGYFVESDKSKTILKTDKVGTSDVVAYCLQGNMIGREEKNGPQGSGVNEDISFTLNTIDRHAVAAVDCRNLYETEELSGTLQAKSNGSGYSLNYQNPVRCGFIVRRLTPVECERLQGYPDGWTEYGYDGKPLCDTARYQALGNSVAIPVVAYVLSGIIDEFYKE